jgi:hypothetical protein
MVSPDALLARLRKPLAAAVLALTALAACSQPAPETPAAPPPAAEAAQAPAEELPVGVTVAAPTAGARVTSPLVATGTAVGTWYFEAVFPARLERADGTLIAEGPGQAQGDWMTTGPVPFRAEVAFQVNAETPAFLVLEEDNTRDAPNPRRVRIPVTLLP